MRTIPPGQVTRLDIARAAGVDPALIRYYFGNKEALLAAAVLEAGKEMRGRTRENTALATSPSEKLRRRMVALLEVLYEDPSLHHLIIEKIIHGHSKQMREFRYDMVHGSCKELASIIERGHTSRRDGHCRPATPLSRNDRRMQLSDGGTRVV